MVTLSWIDLYYLSREFNSQLQGAKVENWYGNHEELHIKLYKSGQKNLFLSTFLSKGIILINNKKYQHNPKNIFIQYLRKTLKNATLEKIYPHFKERVITLELSTKNKETQEIETYYLHIELFMGGQIKICNSKQLILKALKTTQEINNDNQVQQTYQLQITPSQNESIKTTYQQLISTLFDEINEESDTPQFSIQQFFKPLGIGKTYILYLALLANTTPSTPLNISNLKTLHPILETLLTQQIDPTFISSSQEKLQILLPFNPQDSHELFNTVIENQETITSKKYNSSFSQAIISTYHSEFIPQQTIQEPAKLTKLKKRLQQQESHLEQIKKQSHQLEEQAEMFYQYYIPLQELQAKINSIIQENGFQELNSIIKQKPHLKELITTINEKEKTVTISVEKLQELEENNYNQNN